jgi:hypothetical protein
MDSVPLVENKIDAGRRLLDRLGEKGIVVRAACWVKPVDRDRWSLYIATPSVKERDTLPAYRQINPVLRSLGDDWITSSDVVVVGEEHPLVQDARDVLRHFPHRTPIGSPRFLLGGIPVEGLYVYPLGQVEVTVHHLVFPGTTESGILSLDPLLLNGRFSMEIERQGERKEYQGKTGIDCVVAAPEGAKLERDESGQMVLAWDLHGRRMHSCANEVWSLANLGLHGFRFLREPAQDNATNSMGIGGDT